MENTSSVSNAAVSSTSTKNSETPVFSSVGFNFKGNTSEFFGIWIVNVLLTIITLGIYSAWAKVRTTQYFYGNTELDEHRFSYLAKPIDILKGRIVAVLLFVGYYFLSSVFPVVGFIFALVIMFASPYLICSSMRFNMRMTSYRNVRFNFTGKYKEAFWCFLLLPILSIFSLGLAFPYVFYRMDKFIVSNIQYGDRQFKSNFGAQQYYIITLILMCISSAVMMAFMMILPLLGFSADEAELAETIKESVGPSLYVFMTIGFGVYLLLINFATAYYQVSVRNYIFDNTEVENVARFKSNYKLISFALLLFTNLLAIIFTLGLAFPWVKIRNAKYAAEHTEVALTNNKDDIKDLLGEHSSALGDEVANVFDVDIALI
jgi:uncharacterized membrane protein YjgN (DUF898 family)